MDPRDEQILVTGGGGFLGQHLMAALKTAGYRNVYAVRSRVCDLRNEVLVARLFQANQFRTVIHAAAEVGGIGFNQRRAGGIAQSNLRMGLNIVDACVRSAVRTLAVIGTCCSFPIDAPLPMKERDLWNGYPEPTNAAYGIAKRTVSEVAMLAGEQAGFRVLCPILANLVGPGDTFDPARSHAIPAIVRKLAEYKAAGCTGTVPLWGDGTATRDFLHVSDAARGIVHLLRQGAAEEINLGSGVETSIRFVAEHVAGLLSVPVDRITWDASKPGGQPRRVLDVNRAARWGWDAEIPIETGLADVVQDWTARRPLM